MASLIREYTVLHYDRNIVKESKEKGMPILLKTILQRADAPNQNKRIYPKSVLEREVSNYAKVVSEGRATRRIRSP